MSRASLHPDPEIGAALRWLRERVGLHQGELSARLAGGVSVAWLSQVENGRRRPSRVLVTRLLASLDATVGDLDRLLTDRPWARAAVPVGEGAEWAAIAGPPARGRVGGSSARRPAADVAADAELGALVRGYLSLPPAHRRTVLQTVRRLAEDA